MFIKHIHPNLSYMKVKSMQADVAPERILVSAYMHRHIESLLKLGKQSTARNYRSALNSFDRFLNGRKLFLDEIETSLMKEYEAWMSRKGLSSNSSSCYLRQLRAIWNKAIAEGLLTRTGCNPFQDVFTGTRPTPKRGLWESLVWHLESMLDILPPKQAFALSLFLFCYYTRGMSFVDLAHLKKSNIQNGTLVYVRRKTGKQLQIELLPQMVAIINRYAPEVMDSPYLFPILQVGGKEKNYENALRLQNKRLGKIAEVLKLKVKLTTHVARHSWATVARDKNINIHIISEAMGHSSILVTQIYLSFLNGTVINKANRIVLSRNKKQKGRYYESA